MGEIRVRLYGGLDERVAVNGGFPGPDEPIRVEVDGPVRVGEVLGRIGLSEKEVHAVFLGKKRVKLVDEVKDGDTIAVFPPMAGG